MTRTEALEAVAAAARHLSDEFIRTELNGLSSRERQFAINILKPSLAALDAAPADDGEEEWRQAPGWETKYEVSNRGNIRRISDKNVGQWMSDQGYMRARLSSPRREIRVHRLVAEAFVSNENRSSIVNHIDGNRANNNATNLEWCTQSENLDKAGKLGRMQRDYWVGKRSPNAILSNDQVIALRAAYAAGNISLEAIGKSFGISKRAAHRCVNRETYADV